ncbi:MAG: 30S ribosome-binding factor RbfA [Clostridiales bacterium]|nr:30S ribosome-binding factor RbfA [Clostridiales bacterium]
MASYRIGRINDDIKRELASMIPTLKDPRVRGLISITRVDTTTDLRYCRVYVSVLDKDDAQEVMRGLKSSAGYLRRELGRRMTLRYTPELQFIADDSIDRGSRLIQMMNELDIQPDETPAETEDTL